MRDENPNPSKKKKTYIPNPIPKKSPISLVV